LPAATGSYHQNGGVRVCFVCSGNICRSPTAEAIFVALLRENGVDAVEVDSAGIGAWHVGSDMDARARAVLKAHGYPYPRHVARQFTAADFATRDLVVALDGGHALRLAALAEQTGDPRGAAAKIVLLRSFDPLAVAADDLDVPDPYFDGEDGFVEVMQQIQRACRGLLRSPRLAQQTPRAPW
jgi:protein-tyrosine phosphatase